MALNLNKFPPSTLAKLVYPWWQFAPHLQKIERIIIDMYKDDNLNNLILQLPLRFGKTQYVCQLLAATLLCHNLDERILIASYSSTFSSESVARVRDMIAMYGSKINRLEIDPSWSGKDFFRLKNHKGSVRSISISSRFGGADATTIIADDLYCDPAEASSPTMRKSIESWWHGQLMGRKTPNPSHAVKTILIGTPKHPEDLAQQLEASNPDLPAAEKWVIHRLPAIDEKGDSLWPEQFPINKLNEIKQKFEALGQGHYFDTLYMCDPKLNPEGGWPYHYLDHLFPATYQEQVNKVRSPMRIMACDTNTGSQSGRGDYGCVLGAIYDLDNGHIWVDRCYLSRDTYDKLEQAAVEMLIDFNPKGFLIETNSAGQVIADNIDRRAKAAGIQFPPIYHKFNKENKNERIDIMLSPLLATNKLHFRDCKGTRLGLMQMKSWPEGNNDDYPDCLFLLTQMVSELIHTNIQNTSVLRA